LLHTIRSTIPFAVLQGTASVYDYAFARNEAECVTCYEFRVAWKDITDGTPDEFRLRIGIGLGISDYEDCGPQYLPFMGATAFGFVETRGDDTKHNGNTIISAGEKPVETEAEVVDVVVDAVAAPQTFDAGIVAAVAAIVSAAGYAISKKR